MKSNHSKKRRLNKNTMIKRSKLGRIGKSGKHGKRSKLGRIGNPDRLLNKTKKWNNKKKITRKIKTVQSGGSVKISSSRIDTSELKDFYDNLRHNFDISVIGDKEKEAYEETFKLVLHTHDYIRKNWDKWNNDTDSEEYEHLERLRKMKGLPFKNVDDFIEALPTEITQTNPWFDFRTITKRINNCGKKWTTTKTTTTDYKEIKEMLQHFKKVSLLIKNYPYLNLYHTPREELNRYRLPIYDKIAPHKGIFNVDDSLNPKINEENRQKAIENNRLYDLNPYLSNTHKNKNKNKNNNYNYTFTLKKSNVDDTHTINSGIYFPIIYIDTKGFIHVPYISYNDITESEHKKDTEEYTKRSEFITKFYDTYVLNRPKNLKDVNDIYLKNPINSDLQNEDAIIKPTEFDEKCRKKTDNDIKAFSFFKGYTQENIELRGGGRRPEIVVVKPPHQSMSKKLLEWGRERYMNRRMAKQEKKHKERNKEDRKKEAKKAKEQEILETEIYESPEWKYINKYKRYIFFFNEYLAKLKTLCIGYESESDNEFKIYYMESNKADNKFIQNDKLEDHIFINELTYKGKVRDKEKHECEICRHLIKEDIQSSTEIYLKLKLDNKIIATIDGQLNNETTPTITITNPQEYIFDNGNNNYKFTPDEKIIIKYKNLKPSFSYKGENGNNENFKYINSNIKLVCKEKTIPFTLDSIIYKERFYEMTLELKKNQLSLLPNEPKQLILEVNKFEPKFVLNIKHNDINENPIFFYIKYGDEQFKQIFDMPLTEKGRSADLSNILEPHKEKSGEIKFKGELLKELIQNLKTKININENTKFTVEDDDGIKKGFKLSSYLERSFVPPINKNINLTIYTDQFSKELQLIGLKFNQEYLQITEVQGNNYIKQELEKIPGLFKKSQSVSQFVSDSKEIVIISKIEISDSTKNKIIDVKNEIFSLNNLYDLYDNYKKKFNNDIKLKFYFKEIKPDVSEKWTENKTITQSNSNNFVVSFVDVFLNLNDQPELISNFNEEEIKKIKFINESNQSRNIFSLTNEKEQELARNRELEIILDNVLSFLTPPRNASEKRLREKCDLKKIKEIFSKDYKPKNDDEILIRDIIKHILKKTFIQLLYEKPRDYAFENKAELKAKLNEYTSTNLYSVEDIIDKELDDESLNLIVTICEELVNDNYSLENVFENNKEKINTRIKNINKDLTTPRRIEWISKQVVTDINRFLKSYGYYKKLFKTNGHDGLILKETGVSEA